MWLKCEWPFENALLVDRFVRKCAVASSKTSKMSKEKCSKFLCVFEGIWRFEMLLNLCADWLQTSETSDKPYKSGIKSVQLHSDSSERLSEAWIRRTRKLQGGSSAHSLRWALPHSKKDCVLFASVGWPHNAYDEMMFHLANPCVRVLGPALWFSRTENHNLNTFANSSIQICKFLLFCRIFDWKMPTRIQNHFYVSFSARCGSYRSVEKPSGPAAANNARHAALCAFNPPHKNG